MKEKKISFIAALVLVIGMFGICFNYVHADSNDEFVEYDIYINKWDAFSSALFMIDDSKATCLNATESDADTDYDYTMSLMGKKADGTWVTVEDNLNTDNLKVESLNEDYIKPSIVNGKVYLNAIAEGDDIKVILSYTYNGKTYTKDTTWTSVINPIQYFEFEDTDLAVILTDSIVKMQPNAEKNVGVFFKRTSIAGEPIDEDSDFTYKWESSDESVVKVTKNEDTKDATIRAINGGKANVTCTITSSKQPGTTITKTANVQVAGGQQKAGNRLELVIDLENNVRNNCIAIGSPNIRATKFLKFYYDGEELPIDENNLEVKAINPVIIANVKNDSGENELEIGEEGTTSINYKYTYKGEEYTATMIACVYNPEDKFSRSGETVCISKSYATILMKRGGDMSTHLNVMVGNMEGLTKRIPTYKFEWSTNNEDLLDISVINPIDGKQSMATLTLKDYNAGNEAEVYCKVTSLLGGQSITKTVRVKVLIVTTGTAVTTDEEFEYSDLFSFESEDSTGENSGNNQEDGKDSQDEDKKQNDGRANTNLPDTGEQFVILTIAIILLIAAIRAIRNKKKYNFK